MAAPGAAEAAAAAVIRTPEFFALCEKLQRHVAAAVHGHLTNENRNDSLRASGAGSGGGPGASVVVRLRLPARVCQSQPLWNPPHLRFA